MSTNSTVDVAINSGIFSTPTDLGLYGIVIGFDFTAAEGEVRSLELFSDAMFTDVQAQRVMELVQSAILASRPLDVAADPVEPTTDDAK